MHCGVKLKNASAECKRQAKYVWCVTYIQNTYSINTFILRPLKEQLHLTVPNMTNCDSLSLETDAFLALIMIWVCVKIGTLKNMLSG